ncbi:MAG: hypothetical protein KC561_01780, partial [Myxococcales bacterium]|nr:hypothetical protein [Myxococcales bacterium]
EGDTLACGNRNGGQYPPVDVYLERDDEVLVVVRAESTLYNNRSFELRAALIEWGELGAECDYDFLPCGEGLACIDGECREECSAYHFDSSNEDDGEWLHHGVVPGKSGRSFDFLTFPESCEALSQTGADITFEFEAPTAGLYQFRAGFEDGPSFDLAVMDSCEGDGELNVCAFDVFIAERTPFLLLEMEEEQTVTVLLSALYSNFSGRDYDFRIRRVQEVDLGETCDGDTVLCSEGSCINGECQQTCAAFSLNDFEVEPGVFEHTSALPGWSGEDSGQWGREGGCAWGEGDELTYAFSAPEAGTWRVFSDYTEYFDDPIVWIRSGCEGEVWEGVCGDFGEVDVELEQDQEIILVIEAWNNRGNGWGVQTRVERVPEE